MMYQIKRAKASDVGVVTELAMLLWPHNDKEELETEFKDIIKDSNQVLLVAVDNISCDVIAFAHGALRHDYVEGTSSSPVGYLEAIYVNRNYRMHGVARMLVVACEEWAKENKCEEMASDCIAENVDSYNFHLKIGFDVANKIICFKKKL